MKSFAQAGCGVGNTLFPLLETNPEAVAYACDFSPHAVSLVRQHALHAVGHVRAFVADLTQTALTEHVPAGTVDFCSLIFVLSAIDPSKMPQVQRSRHLYVQPHAALQTHIKDTLHPCELWPTPLIRPL